MYEATFLFIELLIIAIAVVDIYRVGLVYRYRSRMITRNLEAYQKLPTFDKMMSWRYLRVLTMEQMERQWGNPQEGQ